jgi:hypothetical protein
MLRHLSERDGVIKAADVAKLDEEQQRRRGILETRHYRLRCEFDQGAKLDDTEKDPRSIDGRRLVAEQHTGDRDDERGRDPRQCAVLEVILSQRSNANMP